MATEFKSIIGLLKAFPDEQACIRHLEKIRWGGNVVSPFDASSKVYKCAGDKYKCKNTGKYFSVRTGTIFHKTKIPLQKWFLALYIFSSHKKGISSYQLARDISVTQKTAWFLLHRLRYAFDHPNSKAILNTEVEIDETFVGGHNKNRHKDKKVKNSQGRSYKDKTPVLGMRQRQGNVIASVVPDTKRATVVPIINTFVEKNTYVYTDEWHAYDNLGVDYHHSRVHHAAREYVNEMTHTNGIENFWSHLKRGIQGIYHWVSRRHLQRYVDEFTLRFNTRALHTRDRFDLILVSASSKRLTYKNLIQSSHENTK